VSIRDVNKASSVKAKVEVKVKAKAAEIRPKPSYQGLRLTAQPKFWIKWNRAVVAFSVNSLILKASLSNGPYMTSLNTKQVHSHSCT